MTDNPFASLIKLLLFVNVSFVMIALFFYGMETKDEKTLVDSPVYEGVVMERYTETEVSGTVSTTSRTEYHIILDEKSYKVDKDDWTKLHPDTRIHYQLTERGSIGNIRVQDVATPP